MSKSQSHKVRLPDGSVIDLQRADLKGWYQRGVIGEETPVQAPGSARWRPLREVIETRASAPVNRAPARNASTAGRRAAGDTLPEMSEFDPHGLAIWKKAAFGFAGVAALVLLVATAGSWWPLLQRLGGEDALAREIRSAGASDRHWSDDKVGLSLDVPDGWLELASPQSLVSAPSDAPLVLGSPRAGALAYLVVEDRPPAPADLEGFVDRTLDWARRDGLQFDAPQRADVSVGELPGRRVRGAARRGGEMLRHLVTAWRDGWTYVALVAWSPEDRGDRLEPAVDALLAGVSSRGSGVRLRQAVERVTREAPMLTPRAAELVMSQSAAGVLDPPEAFRRAYNLIGQGLGRLDRSDTREMGALHSAVYASLPARQRRQLAAYIERVRARRPTSPQQDREMAEAMRAAVERLAPARRARLRQLFEKTIQVALGAAA